MTICHTRDFIILNTSSHVRSVLLLVAPLSFLAQSSQQTSQPASKLSSPTPHHSPHLYLRILNLCKRLAGESKKDCVDRALGDEAHPLCGLTGIPLACKEPFLFAFWSPDLQCSCQCKLISLYGGGRGINNNQQRFVLFI